MDFQSRLNSFCCSFLPRRRRSGSELFLFAQRHVEFLTRGIHADTSPLVSSAQYGGPFVSMELLTRRDASSANQNEPVYDITVSRWESIICLRLVILMDC